MNNNNKKSFVESFDSVHKNLSTRYAINMHLDFIQEFIKFADNTRDINLQNDILDAIKDCLFDIYNLVKHFEDERNNEENID